MVFSVVDMTCGNYIDCPESSTFPLLGYSAETTDMQMCVANGFGPVTGPPLNWSFSLVSGFSIRRSTVSPQAALIAATNAAIAQAEATWVSPDGVAPIEQGDSLDDYSADAFLGIDSLPLN